MDDQSTIEEAVETLQQLGLREYEAECFVALTRLPHGTARTISEISDVPRTRVYDATRVLESKGLVEVQHSSPQRFRATSVEEAVRTLQSEYETRVDRLADVLRSLPPAQDREDGETSHQVWALSGETAVTNRTHELVDEADEEVVMIFDPDFVDTASLADKLQDAKRGGVSLIVGSTDEAGRAEVQSALPEVDVFVSGLEWLTDAEQDDEGDDTTITRLLLIDGETILVSTVHPDDENATESAVFGSGFDNGVVTIVRRLLRTRLRADEALELTD
jgi:sugar-specific transcriptional regulator TrmB